MRWKKLDRSDKIRFIISLTFLVLFCTLILSLFLVYKDLIFSFFSKDKEKRQQVIELLNNLESSYAWLVLIGLNIVQVVVAVIPGGPICFAAGIIYGTFWGSVISLCGLTLGALVVFGLVKVFGKGFVRIFVDVDSNRYEFLNNPAKALPIIFAILIFPGIPKDFVCFLIPFTSISIVSFLLINLIARTPATIMTVMFGEGLREQNYFILGLLFFVFALISILVLVFRKRLTLFLEARMNKVSLVNSVAISNEIYKGGENMENMLRQYAALIARKGINPVKGQLIVISSDVENYKFVRLLVEECYKLEPYKVIVDYYDPYNDALFFQYAKDDAIDEVAEYLILREKYNIEHSAAFIRLRSPNNHAFDNVGQSRVSKRNKALNSALKFSRSFTSCSQLQWCVCAASNETWASEVFPELDKKEANLKLWQEIFDICLISNTNTIQNWEEHSSNLRLRSNVLNELKLDRLVFKNSLGTDLVVNLPTDYIFAGGDEVCLGLPSVNIIDNQEFKFSSINPKGQVFAANIPTQEVFTTPHRLGVNGTVYATKPLPYNGGLIKDFSITFKDGKAVSYSAKEGQELLSNLINFDEGSSYLGEVALVSHYSPISTKNHLFYSILYDENASCHLALGDSYPTCIKNGDKLSKEELKAAGGNVSNTHVDFMFGSACMNITGYTKDGKEIKIMTLGEFVI